MRSSKANTPKRLAVLAILVAMASAVHVLEGLLPPVFPAIPGARLGLANIFSLFALVVLGGGAGYTVMLLRCLVGTLIGGSVTGLFYAVAGGVLSCTAMLLLHRLVQGRISLYGISVVGAFFHNLGQILVASLLMDNLYVFSYFPYLALVSVPAGLITGLATTLCIKSMRGSGVIS